MGTISIAGVLAALACIPSHAQEFRPAFSTFLDRDLEITSIGLLVPLVERGRQAHDSSDGGLFRRSAGFRFGLPRNRDSCLDSAAGFD
jgi:hypothetical protein